MVTLREWASKLACGCFSKEGTSGQDNFAQQQPAGVRQGWTQGAPPVTGTGRPSTNASQPAATPQAPGVALAPLNTRDPETITLGPSMSSAPPPAAPLTSSWPNHPNYIAPDSRESPSATRADGNTSDPAARSRPVSASGGRSPGIESYNSSPRDGPAPPADKPAPSGGSSTSPASPASPAAPPPLAPSPSARRAWPIGKLPPLQHSDTPQQEQPSLSRNETRPTAELTETAESASTPTPAGSVVKSLAYLEALLPSLQASDTAESVLERVRQDPSQVLAGGTRAAAPAGSADGPASNRQYYYVIHGSSRPLKETVTMLLQHFSPAVAQGASTSKQAAATAAEDVFFWLDVLSLDHTGELQGEEDTITDALKGAKAVLLVLDKYCTVLSDMRYLFQIWLAIRLDCVQRLRVISRGSDFVDLCKHIVAELKPDSPSWIALGRIISSYDAVTGGRPAAVKKASSDLRHALITGVMNSAILEFQRDAGRTQFYRFYIDCAAWLLTNEGFGRLPPKGEAEEVTTPSLVERDHLGAAAQRCVNDDATQLKLMQRIYRGVTEEGLEETSNSFDKGWVYMYKHKDSNEGLYKIGRHTGTCSEERLKQWWKDCGIPIEKVYDRVVKFPIAAEGLIHEELKGRGKHANKLPKCRGCGKVHTEWFSGTKEELIAVIDHWADYVNKNEWLLIDGSIKNYGRRQ
ncbi:hypothetical protein Agub_g3536 [Astrephomene gubernaculifera]|uniref:Bacteriophage T5 Orf172 DNA-binding domain-containing protein n=1 Tax=Astrephomene gubernaculifera TaxID=47775 RepID=A0AAD3HJG2_9CHLO|nr:hypothetical protein Agub_g3536 [Astrephomene gubernaculifera]